MTVPVPALELQGVAKSYGPVAAVTDLSLQVAPGDFLTILGPSGSGKTTVLMMIAGFIYPDSGRILFGGDDVTWMPPHLRNVGMVFQQYALFPHMTVHDNVAFPLRMRGVAAAAAREQVAAALELVHMSAYGDRMPAQLSGGQQQRVALARALVFRPSLLLMDEPLGALDRYLRERMQLEIKAIQKATGVTIVYVTHDQDEALVLSDHVVIMRDGRIRMAGSPRDVYQRPADSFVAEFIGDTNLLRGTIAGSGGDRRLVVRPGLEIPLGSRGRDRATGTEAALCLRPEQVTVPAGAGPVLLRGDVADVTFLGDTVRYRVALAGTAPPVIIVGKQLAGAGPVPEAGQPTTVGWNPEDAWMIDSTA